VELRHLRYFIAVAEESHFGRAAQRLLISTPTLSQQVMALERDVGAPLFIRHARGASLSAAGEALLPEARRVLQAADSALWAARAAGGVGSPPLRLGVLSAVPEWLPARLEQMLTAALPHAKPVLVGAVSSEQIALLVRGELDLAMVRTPIERPGDVRLLPIYRENIGVLMSPVSPLAAKPALHCPDLAGRELILFPRERAPGAYDDLLSKLRKAGGTVTVSKSAVPMSQLRATLPLRPAAIALVPCRAAAPPDVVWRPLAGNPLTATIAVAWRASTRNTQVRALLASLRRAVASGPLSAS
jgi:DNA-binding transcriptional LysR family regulator